MQSPGHNLLSASRLTRNESCAEVRGHPSNQVEDLQHEWAVADDALQVGHISKFSLQGAGSLLLGAHTSSAWLAAASLTVATALVLATEGPYWASMTTISGPHSGTGGGVMNFGSNLDGLISPVITPWLAARLGWETALALAAALAVVGALLWFGITIDPVKAKPGTSE
jgi:ACS family glucarate transporter-like MFS transporter